MRHYTKLPLVSVIVPVYNTEKYLSRCIDSIIRQTYSDLEVLLINDGSSDKSGTICREYADIDNRIKVINQSNQGVSKARNRGLEVASGEFVCFVDSDDWIDDTHIEGLVVSIAGNDCICEGYIRGNTQSILEAKRVDLFKIDGNELAVFFVNGYVHPCWNKLFKKSIIEDNNIRFPTDISISEDSLFCLKYLSCSRMLALSERATYHYWADNAVSTLSKKVYPNALDIYGKVYREIENLLSRGECQNDIAENILVQTIFPQIYSTAIKIVRADYLCFQEKTEHLDKLINTEYVARILRRTYLDTHAFAEKVSLFLVLHRRYRLLEFLWKSIIK